jgi:DNA-binding CsgD family transcriptional regulator
MPAISQDRRYKKVYDFLLTCGNAHSPKSFAVEIVSNIRELCPFDAAIVYFMDGNGRICNQYLVNTDVSWSNMYLEYYAGTENQKYSCIHNLPTESELKSALPGIKDWERESSQEFVPNFIRPRRLKYSIGFPLFDLNGIQRVVVCLDRTRTEKFSEDEQLNVALAIPHLNNLHKNLYYWQPNSSALKQIAWEETNLTPREIEVGNLLCQGVTPANISRTLYISLPTVYKHISHIYEKTHVSSRQELLVRLLRRPNY